MRTWLRSRSGALTLTLLFATGAGLALANRLAIQGVSTRTVAASLLILCFVVFTFGGVLYAGRDILKWPIGDLSTYLIWERGFVIGGIVCTALGLALLEDLLRAAGDPFLAHLGFVTFFSGAVVALAAETSYIGKRDWNNAQIVLYVTLAFLGQAAFGAALLQTGLVAAWVGGATIAWNLIWPLGLLVFSRRNVYFPALHHVAPLLVGIALLAGSQ